MSGATLFEFPWRTTGSSYQEQQISQSNTEQRSQTFGPSQTDDVFSSPLKMESETLVTPSDVSEDAGTNNLDRYIALGCLHLDHFDCPSSSKVRPRRFSEWFELFNSDFSGEVQSIIGSDATRLLEVRWIRLFLHQSPFDVPALHSLIRVYLLPEDWARRSIDRNSRSLKLALRQLLRNIDTSTNAWAGDRREAAILPFDPWASAENVSLYYLFNRLPSPSPDPGQIRSRYTRAAVNDLLRSAAQSEWEEHGEQPLAGLKTRLYPYQARSASLMIQREAQPALQLDPRLELRTSPNGVEYFFGARDGSFLHEARYYEANRGGILAETMGLGKTIICLAVILTTKGHSPQIPATYFPPLPVRSRVGRLSDMAASNIGRHSIPAKALVEQSEQNHGVDYSYLKDALQRHTPFYEIPPEMPRMNRNTRVPPPRQLVMCSGTIIVVPRNLLHQWQSEIRKHVLPGGLRVLVIDSVKRGKPIQKTHESETMRFVSDLPPPTELMGYDVVLFTRNRFEKEIQDGADDQGRRAAAGVNRVCNCAYIGSTRIPDCNCLTNGIIYESPLQKLHWLRIIIDEGHSFSSSMSNAVLVAKQIQAERRWVVSGTPAKNLVGVEVDMSVMDVNSDNTASLRDSTIEQRKDFSNDEEGRKAAKALGLLASNFLMVRPWSDSGAEGKLEWDDYIFRHEDHYKRTYSGFSACFVRTLEGLVVKTRPEDVEKDIILPPMTHRVVYLKPCWFDKMTANLFIQVLRANAVTSERQDVDYLFHKNSVKARHSLIRNLRQSNFTWTGFRLDDVVNTVETTYKYLAKDDKKCSPEDAAFLLESCQAISELANSKEWIALNKAHEVGMAIEAWPAGSEEFFALAFPAKPAMVGITQLIDGQLHVDSHILSTNPAMGLEAVGQAGRAKIVAMAEAEERFSNAAENASRDSNLMKTGVPPSVVGGQQPTTPHRASTATSKRLTQSTEKHAPNDPAHGQGNMGSPSRPRKRKLTMAEEQADLAPHSELRKTHIVGTTSAKLTYIIEKVMQHQATEKIIIFYDGDNAAYYIAQCLEVLYINHRIYARTLDNTKRSAYVAAFNEDPDIRVLLIDVACGALGLNLNAASLILIVNPINRPEIEAQAIKRAHRIGQSKKTLVETLVLEDTIEHAIFIRAKKMSRAQHLEAKELEDDAGIADVIQNARILPVLPTEKQGEGMFAKLHTPQQVFGRPSRDRYHRYGMTDPKTQNKPRKKVKSVPKVSKSLSDINSRSEYAGVTFVGTDPEVSDATTSTGAGLADGSVRQGLLEQAFSIFGNP